MTTSLEVRSLETIKHQSFEYAISNLYIPSRKDEQDITVHIRREVHLVDNLKANMFIDNDVIEPKSIVIDVKKREVYIDNCDVTTHVEIKSFKFVIRSIHLQKTTIISSRTKMSLVVHHFDVSKDRDFLFEFENNTILAFYANMINASTKAIIARNDNDKSMQISRNYRLDHVVEINYSNAFVVEARNEDVRNLIVRELKITHQDS